MWRFERKLFAANPYRTDFGRVCGVPLLYRTLVNRRVKIALQPERQVAHYFAWWYWLFRLHFRYGHEVCSVRRIDPECPNQWIRRAAVFEPLVSMVWHMPFDVPRWFRFSALVILSARRRWLVFPLPFVMSRAARAAEMAGMYATLLSPNTVRRWAQSV